MLYLNPPYITHEDIVIGRDYGDPLQFWYFPGRPRIAVDDGKPAIRFLIYKDLDQVHDEDATVGFLMFDTVLSMPDQEGFEKRAAARLKQALGLDGEPRVAPLQYRSGKVRLVFLDRKTPPEGAPPPTPEEERNEWVTVMESAGQPSLYGENRAIFSVGLTKKATSLLYGSFEDFIPAGVVYELDYTAMQRAFQVKVDVKWDELYDYVRDYEKDRTLFWSDEVEKIVRHLESTKVIEIKSSIEGVGDEGMQGEYAEVRKTLTQYVFEKFFEPKINSQELLDGNTANNVLGFLGGLRDAGFPFEYGCSKRELHDRQSRDLDIDYTVERAVERMIAPQGHLSLFWKDLGVTRDDIVTVVDSEDGIWETTSLRVLASATFDDANVARIVVDVCYGDIVDGEPAPDAKTDSVVLDGTHPEETIDNWYDPDLGNQVHYRFTVAFGPKAKVGEGVVLTSEWRPAREGIVTVNALELYQERSVEFQRSALLKPELFPEVLVHARYVAPDSGWTFQESGLLKGDGTSTWTPSFRLPTGAPTAVDYRLEYPRENGDVIDTGWRSTTESAVVARDPRENVYDVRVLVAGDRTQVAQILVDLEYVDEDAGIHETGSFSINQETINSALEWAFPRAELDRKRYRYNQVIVDVDGTVTAPGWVQTDAPVLMVGKVYAAKWSIVPDVVGPPLAENGLERIVVTIAYDDDAHAYHEASEQSFVAPQVGAPLELELRDVTHRSYTYTVRYVFTNGFERKVGPLSGSDTFLVVSSVPPVG